MIKKILPIVLLGFVLLTSLLFNVAIHEIGHWSVAEAYDFNPKIHLKSSNLTTTNFMVGGEPAIYTSYLGSQSTAKQDAIVAFAGPLANLLVFFGILGIYFTIPKKKRTIYVDLLFIALALPALVSFIGNLVPVAGSDGWIIYNKLF